MYSTISSRCKYRKIFLEVKRSGMNHMNFAGKGTQQHPPQGSPNAARTSTRNSSQPLRPVTVKMLLEAQQVGEGAVVVDGREIGVVTLCGRVVDYDHQQPNANSAKVHGYRVSDGSGVLTVRHWLPVGQSGDPLPVGSFIRSNGTVKTWQGAPVLTGIVRNMPDVDEFTFHLLDCIHTHLRMTQPSGKLPAKQLFPPTPVATSGGSVADAVERFMRFSPRATGYSFDELSNAVVHPVKTGSRCTAMEIREAVRVLTSDGRAFSCGENRYTATS